MCSPEATSRCVWPILHRRAAVDDLVVHVHLDDGRSATSGVDFAGSSVLSTTVATPDRSNETLRGIRIDSSALDNVSSITVEVVARACGARQPPGSLGRRWGPHRFRPRRDGCSAGRSGPSRPGRGRHRGRRGRMCDEAGVLSIRTRTDARTTGMATVLTMPLTRVPMKMLGPPTAIKTDVWTILTETACPTTSTCVRTPPLIPHGR